ncbi:hypothetical protein [Fusibacter sp. 3D3]|uniref:hypothetical protein n=1 Tax=Fusibacter sp. 3D3 TaxID=1048380 RepID=UPI000853D944|nr:hypothetical protein [Fusibacter sp. 3D3]GAU76711.1 hypothetical protein F3D3_1308 [Fusibacter sp. 3D3]
MMNTLLAIIFFTFILGGSVGLQIFLSTRQNKWLGLIIPIICFMLSLLIVANIAVFTTFTTTSKTEIVNGEVINQGVVQSQTSKKSLGEILAMVIPVFIMSNLSTLIFYAIYLGCREKRKKNLALEKMRIQDLE